MNPVGSDQRQVEVSYDVSNEFFRLWLDEAMFYTSAVFEREGQTLEEAQRNKMRILCDFAGIDAKSHVLDIGCGWGAAMEYVKREKHAEKVDGITLSRAQMDEINRRGVPGLSAIVQDYRTYEPKEKYSALISICMIDHLCSPEEARKGKAIDIYREYFKKAWEITTPGAKFGFQAILRNRVPRDKKDLAELHWVTHEIFPGGLNPRLEELIAAVNPYWEVREVHTRREDYRKTTHEWRRRLRANEAKIRSEFGDQVFVDYDRYLSCCVTSFEKHYSSLTQMRLHRIDA
jgi:cyclopropane-fatty-acyl-phospholipid synthase